MMRDKVEIEVFGRKHVVEMEGLTALEISAVAKTVSELMAEIAAESKIVDSSKLAVLTALQLAADKARLREQLEAAGGVEERKLDGMILALQSALGSQR